MITSRSAGACVMLPRSHIRCSRAPGISSGAFFVGGEIGSRTAAWERGNPMMRQYELVERVQAYNPHTDEALLNKAYVYAMQKHGTQKRASGDPYFAHPLEVAAILTELKLDDASIAVALLHDTIEDTDATRAEIDQMFGPEIGVHRRWADQDRPAAAA